MIDAVMVNHNTSAFAELAARSLFALNADAEVRLTIIDNGSADGVEQLCDYADSVGISVVQSGMSTAEGRNTHGENLARFILDRPDAEYFLLLDSDICFTEDGTIDSMFKSFEERTRCWGVQAKMLLFAEVLYPDWKPGAPRPFYWRLVHKSGEDLSAEEAETAFERATSYSGSMQPRPHPFCLLVRNSPIFRRVVDAVGLSTAFVNADDPWGGWYDTTALAARVLTSHDLEWAELEEKPVLHYAYVSEGKENPDLLRAKIRDCSERLAKCRDSS